MAQQQLNDFLKNITEANQRIWGEWTQKLQSSKMPGGEMVEKLYQQNLDVTEKVIKDTLAAEAAWLDQWHAGIAKTPNAPAPMLELLEGIRNTMKAMLEHRAKMWEAWLDQARSMNFEQMPSITTGEGTQQTLMKVWEDFYRQASAAQQQMMDQLSPKEAPAGKKGK